MYRPHHKLEVNAGDLEGLVLSALHVTPVSKCCKEVKGI